MLCAPVLFVSSVLFVPVLVSFPWHGMVHSGTANVHFLLPIVVTTCTAKLVGNLFGHEGVYEIGLRRKKLRYATCQSCGNAQWAFL